MGKSLQSGKYILEQELGRGGFGVTYKAINTVLSQTVVVKTLNESLRQDPKFANSQRQFQDEARRLARFVHPHIVRVTDFFIEDDLPYIVMDYIPGQTLDTIVLPDHPLPEAIALHYIRQVSAAVKVVHENGLLHRDIKPQNIILQQGTQNVILIDFGIAREFTPGLTQTHTHFISEGYAPIEQYMPQAKRSPAADIYGLAATLYTLLTAQVPVAATLRDRLPLAAPREVRPELSAMVSAGVMRGIAVEPHHRPASVDEWLALLPDATTQQVGGVTPAGTVKQNATNRPHSQMATVAIAPAHYPRPTDVTPAAATPAKASRVRPWLLGLIGLAAIIPFGVGYALLRSPNPSNEPTTQVPATTTPSPSPVGRESGAIAEDAEPSSTELPPDTNENEDEAASPSETPTSEELTTSEPVAPPPAEATAPAEPEPPAPEPEVSAEDAEAVRRAEEQAREDRKREEEQAREAEEQAREAERREAEQQREQEQGRNEERGEGGGKDKD